MRMVRRWPAWIAALVLLQSAGPAVAAPVRAAEPAASLEVVGQDSLGGRGMNAALSIAGNCAYVGSRNAAAPLVVDISKPSSPRVAGSLAGHAGSTPRELRAVPTAHELVVLFYGLSGGVNELDIYRWTSDCLAPAPVAVVPLGAAPHEFYVWQDPARPARVLVYVTFFGAAGEGLQVIDVSDPAHPSRLGGLSLPAAYGHAPVHSVALSGDGASAYISLWTGGLVVADVGDFAAGKPAPVVRLVTPPGAVFKTPPGNVHSAVALPGTTDVLTTDERYPTPYGQGCPFGTAHIVSVANPARPVAIATLAVPENTPAVCAAATRGTWTSHNPTVTAHLALVSWYSAGLQVFGLDDPAQPTRLAEARPAGTNPTARDLELGTTDAMSWSYPVIAGGLVYLVDINQGLVVYRYHGAHEDEVAGTALLDGSTNAVAAETVAASPTPAPGPTPRLPAPARAAPGGAFPGVSIGAGTGAIAVALAAGLVARRRRRQRNLYA